LKPREVRGCVIGASVNDLTVRTLSKSNWSFWNVRSPNLPSNLISAVSKSVDAPVDLDRAVFWSERRIHVGLGKHIRGWIVSARVAAAKKDCSKTENDQSSDETAWVTRLSWSLDSRLTRRGEACSNRWNGEDRFNSVSRLEALR